MVTLVTGAFGFLGRHIAEALRANGDEVVAAGRPEIEIPSAAFDALLRSAAPQVVVHSAGPASVPQSVEDPTGDRAGSVEVTRALVESLERLPVPPRIVVLSSAAVYGDPLALPVSETTAPAPISPYGRHRLEAEELVRASRLRSTTLRIFSAYGAGLRRQILWDVASRALEHGAVTLSGTGDESRDFVHARDVARAVVAVCAADDIPIVNVASGNETTIRELASLLVAALDVPASVEFTGLSRAGDPARWQADVTRLRAIGWTPTVPLAEGVADYARWARGVLT